MEDTDVNFASLWQNKSQVKQLDSQLKATFEQFAICNLNLVINIAAHFPLAYIFAHIEVNYLRKIATSAIEIRV